MKMVGVATEIIRPAISAKGCDEDFQIGVGVTKGTVFTTKAGVRGDDNLNDLIWPCTPVNLAARLGDKASYPYNIFISDVVYGELSDYNKTTKNSWGIQESIWQRQMVDFAGTWIYTYRSSYYRSLT